MTEPLIGREVRGAGRGRSREASVHHHSSLNAVLKNVLIAAVAASVATGSWPMCVPCATQASSAREERRQGLRRLFCMAP